MAVCLTDWPSDKLSGWLTDLWTDCLTFCVTYSLFDWLSGRQAVLFYTLSDWKNGWPPVQPTVYLTDQLADFQTICCTHCRTNWPTDWLTYLLFNIHTVWLTDFLACSLSYTFYMLADWLCYILPGKFLGLNYSLLEILPKNAFRSK